ncbi:unnamed protein product [Calypogeia fissa]
MGGKRGVTKEKNWNGRTGATGERAMVMGALRGGLRYDRGDEDGMGSGVMGNELIRGAIRPGNYGMEDYGRGFSECDLDGEGHGYGE